jgi:hypothetical protein
MAYRLSGSTYTLVDSQVVTVIPADNTVAVLPLYLSVKAGDFLVFSAPLCFDSLVNFGVNFADAGYSIYSPPDSTIPASIPASHLPPRRGQCYVSGLLCPTWQVMQSRIKALKTR